jgi:hypothetical protein
MNKTILRHRFAKGLRVFFTATLLAGLALSVMPMPVAYAATYEVDRFDDDAGATACTAAANDCSLRGAITAANGNPGADVITLPAGTYTLTIAGAGEDANATGDLDITDDLTINGADEATTIIDGNQLDRVLHVMGEKTVVINDVTIRNGRTADGADDAGCGAGRDGGDGGGIYNSGDLTLNRCTVKENATGNGATTCPAVPFMCGQGGSGGGIFNEKTLTLNDSTVKDNTTGNGGPGGAGLMGGAGGGGGGIYNYRVLFDKSLKNFIVATVNLTNSTVSGNTTGNGGVGSAGNRGGMGGVGGGICNGGGTVNLTNSTVSANTTGNGGDGGGALGGGGGPGGGIFNGGRRIAPVGKPINSTDTKNLIGTVNLTNSTVSGNTTGDGGDDGGNGGGGGGIGNGGTVNLTNSTVSANTTGEGEGTGEGGRGGGIYDESDQTTNLKNTIVAGNSAAGIGPDCHGGLNSQDYNLIQDTSDCIVGGTTAHNITGQDPRLDALALNAPGNTKTHALLAGSPATDAIPEGGTGYNGAPATDQRGVTRPQGANCDIGAYEVRYYTLTVNVGGGGGGSGTGTRTQAGGWSGTVISEPAGINCGADCAESYNKYTVVTLKAYPGVKSYFVGWGGDCDTNGQVTMDADKTCTATFGYPVGGIVVPVDKLGLVAPWMGLVGLASLVIVTVTLVRRRKSA